MTVEMFAVFSVMSVLSGVLLGVFWWSVRVGIAFSCGFLGFCWGVGLGTLITDNDLVWFFVFAPFSIGILFFIVRLIDSEFFAKLNRDIEKRKT